MIFWKEWRETLPLALLSALSICLVSQIRWEGWRREFFEFQFWAVTALGLSFTLIFLGAGAIAGEREDGTFDKLLAMPVGLRRIFVTKYLVRLASIVLILAVLFAFFVVIRPTHNLMLEDVAKGLVILFGFLLFCLTVSFCASCFTDTSAKALVAGVILVYMLLFAANDSPFFKYVWWWSNSLDELWYRYLFFYGALSLIILTIAAILFGMRVFLNFGWRPLAVASIVLFLIFVRSVSTTFWLIPQIAMSGDLGLVILCRQPVEKLLDYASTHKGRESDLLIQYLTSSHDRRVDRELIQQLASSDGRIRNEAVKLLTSRKTQKAGAAIVPLLGDPNDEVRHSAISFIWEFKPKEVEGQLIALLHDPNSSIRQTAAHALGAVGGKEAGKYLMPLLDDPNPRVSTAAAYQLCKLDYVEAQPKIVSIMVTSPAKYTRQSIALFLGSMKSAPACDALVEALSSDDPRFVDSAARSLGELRRQEAVKPLLEKLNDDSYWSKPTVSPAGKLTIIAALKKIGGPEAIHEFRTLFADPAANSYSKAEIAVSLAEMGDSTGIPYLRKFMQEEISKQKPTGMIREYAIRLAEVKEYCAVPVLIAMLDEGYPQQRYDYGKILEKITGKKYGWDSRRWKKWWDKNEGVLLQPVPEASSNPKEAAS